MNDAVNSSRNSTFEKFGGKDTLIHDYSYWSLQVRPAQATLGALILLAHGPAVRFGDLDAAAHAELTHVTRDIETRIGDVFSPEKYNYLMLMMVDPHVHFHVLPRYGATQIFSDIEFPDSGWPALPDLGAAPSDSTAATVVRDALRKVWR